MKPAPLDIEFKRGDKFTLFYRTRTKNPDGSPGAYVDLTGYTVGAMIRQTDGDGAVLATFTASLGDQVLFPGSVLLTLLTADTTDIPVGSDMVWDCELVDAAGEPRTVLEGKVTVTKDVTHV